MTAVTAPLALVLALVLTGCAPDARIEENTTITLGQHGLSFVVPKNYRQADNSVIRARIAADLKRSLPAVEKGDTKDVKKDGETGIVRTASATKKGGKGTPAVSVPTPEQVRQALFDSYEAYLIDPVTEASKNLDTVAVLALPTPLTTGSAALFSASLAGVRGISSVDVVNQGTKAGPVLRGSYQITVGKDAEGEDIEVSYETIQLGLDDTSSLQVTVSSMDGDVARDLADTVVASLTTTN